MSSHKKAKGLAAAVGSKKPIPVKIVHDKVEASPAHSDNEMKWKAQDALRDIQRAEKHKSDAKLMKHVKQLAKEDMKALKRIC